MPSTLFRESWVKISLQKEDCQSYPALSRSRDTKSKGYEFSCHWRGILCVEQGSFSRTHHDPNEISLKMTHLILSSHLLSNFLICFPDLPKQLSWYVQFEHTSYQKWICPTTQQMNKSFYLFAFLWTKICSSTLVHW